jgi:hypothetical protein
MMPRSIPEYLILLIKCLQSSYRKKSWFNFNLSLMRETLIDEQNGMTLDKVLEYGVSQTEPT